MTGLRALPAVVLPVLLGGCVVLPEYVARADEPMASIDVARLPDPAICVDGVGYRPAPAGEGVVRVPAGRRVSLYSSFHASDGYMTYTCTAGAGATFAPGSRLVAALEQTSDACRIDLVQLVDTTPTGVAPEPSLGAPACNPWQRAGE